jgi:hypothetical protein
MGWLTHGDAKSRFEAYQLGRNMGVYTVNEIRRMEGMNDIGADGETRMVPLNMTPLDQLGKEPAANADPAAPDTGTQAEGSDSGALRNAVARDAVALVYAAAFDRYGKRLRAREEDLQRAGKSAKAITENLAAERERGRARLVEECAAARDLMLRMGAAPPSDDALLAAAEAVARGEDAGARCRTARAGRSRDAGRSGDPTPCSFGCGRRRNQGSRGCAAFAAGTPTGRRRDVHSRREWCRDRGQAAAREIGESNGRSYHRELQLVQAGSASRRPSRL